MSNKSQALRKEEHRLSLAPRERQALAAAAGTPAGWTYIRSGSASPGPEERLGKLKPLVLNIKGNNPNRDAQIIVWPLEPSSPNELWMFTADGYVISSLHSNMCLTAGDDGSVLSIPVTVMNEPAQRWSWGDDGTIASQLDGRVLTAGAPGDDGFSYVNVTSVGPDGPSPDQIWSFYPANPLAGILTRSQPFPDYSGDLGTAYAAIMSQLSGGQPGFDLRSQYPNLAAPLGAWLSTILTMPVPDGVDSPAFVTVQQQLAHESTAAIAVQALFENYTTCHLALFSSQEAILSKAIDDASIDTSSKTSGVFQAIVWGITYTVMQLDPETAVFANLIQGGINAAAAAKHGVVASNAFQVEVSALWKLLNQGFNEILEATAVIEDGILSDWGRLQAAYAEIIGTQGSLAWPADMTARIAANSTSGSQNAMLQALVPSKYQCYFVPTGDGSIGDPPSSCVWQYGNLTYEIASNPGSGDLSFPDYMMTSDVNGVVPPESFYLGRGGWATPQAGYGSDLLTLMVTNQTNRFVSVFVVQDGKQQGNTDPIAPWNCLTVTWPCGGLDGSASITVSDSSSQQVAAFQIYQDGNGGLPAVQHPSPSAGYGLSTAVCNERYKGAGSSCQITLFSKVETGSTTLSGQ